MSFFSNTNTSQPPRHSQIFPASLPFRAQVMLPLRRRICNPEHLEHLRTRLHKHTLRDRTTATTLQHPLRKVPPITTTQATQQVHILQVYRRLLIHSTRLRVHTTSHLLTLTPAQMHHTASIQQLAVYEKRLKQMALAVSFLGRCALGDA